MRLAMFLGPYRNLTTLSAAIIALHPECQVLNHGAQRLLADERIDFFLRPDAATMNRFIEVARVESSAGRRGLFGGSLLFSHAFDDPALKALYTQRYGDALVKADAKCMVWKDSLHIQHKLMEDVALFDRLCTAFPDMRFILPIRDPLECAASNAKRSGASQQLTGHQFASLEETLEAILDVIAWVIDKRDKRPDHVFIFTHKDMQPRTFQNLAGHLGLTPTQQWLKDSTSAGKVRINPYQHDAAFVQRGCDMIRVKLRRWPALLTRLGYA
jgi:hypothetical protein